MVIPRFNLCASLNFHVTVFWLTTSEECSAGPLAVRQEVPHPQAYSVRPTSGADLGREYFNSFKPRIDP